MEKIINFILEEVPSSVKNDIDTGVLFIRGKTPRIIFLFNNLEELTINKGLDNTIKTILNNERLNDQDKVFAELLIAHLILFFNFKNISKMDNVPLNDKFKYLFKSSMYGLNRETIKKYL